MELIHGLTLGGALTATARRYPLRPALEFGAQIWTYEALDRDTDALAKGLLARGIRLGVHVGLWSDGRPTTLLYLYALLKLGAVPVLLGGSRTGSELDTRLQATDTAYLLYDEAIRATTCSDLLQNVRLPGVAWTLYIGPAPAGEADAGALLRQEGSALPDSALAQARAQVREDSTDMILFTSGSSGAPKGVMTTHFSRLNNTMAHCLFMEITPEDRFCAALPLFHCFSICGVALAAMEMGACVCLPQDYHTASILQTVQDHRCTVLTAVPTLFSALLANKDFARYDLRSLRTGLVGGSICPPRLFERICQALDFDLLPGFGQTEATGMIAACSLSDPLEVRAASVGRFMPHTEGSIRAVDTGEPLPPGVQGEICLRGYSVMQGYYKQPERTAQTLDAQGWLHTGDMGWIDGAGNLHISGRIKDLIICGGENIAPAEVEALLSGESHVREVKVVGVPDPHYIEALCACVVTQGPVTAQDLRDYAAARSASYKVPKYILFWDQLPQTPNGKVSSAAVRAAAMKELGLRELD